MRPVMSNIGTAAYKIAKYLNKLLTPLNKSDNNILKRKTLQGGLEKKQFQLDIK